MLKSHTRAGRAVFCAILVSLATTHTAAAGVVTFDFNSLNGGLGAAAVETYMNAEIASQLGLPSGTYVDVTKAKTNKTYTGDGYVTGPRFVGGAENNGTGGNGTVPRPMTLGSSEGDMMHQDPNLWDTYLINTNANGSGEDRITLIFNFPIYAVSFDYEIFPDGTPDQPPDFRFEYDGALVTPPGIVQGILPGTGGIYPYSPRSTSGSSDNPETALQYIGESGLLSLSPGPGPTWKLEFIDWPQRIGIDNLEIYTSPVPEPGSLAIWCGTIAVGTVLCRRKRRKRAAGAALSAAA
jgi:hypothetical protein